MTIYEKIIQFLEERNDWVYGGILERHFTEHKPSNISRRCRELWNKGILERRLVKIDGIANKVVSYRIKQEEKPFWVLPKQIEIKTNQLNLL